MEITGATLVEAGAFTEPDSLQAHSEAASSPPRRASVADDPSRWHSHFVSNGFEILDTQGASATQVVSLAAVRRCSIAASIRSITGT